MQGAYASLWRSVFLLALLLELPIVALGARGARGRAVLASLLGNAITHPLLWFVWPRVLPWNVALIAGELTAIGVEGALIAWLGAQGRRGFALALAANLYSWAVGEYVMRVLGPRLATYWFRI